MTRTKIVADSRGKSLAPGAPERDGPRWPIRTYERSILNPAFRQENRDAEEVWQKLADLGVPESPEGADTGSIYSLFNAAEHFVMGSYMQEASVWINKGLELPQHTEMKADLSALELEGVLKAELDRKKWKGAHNRRIKITQFKGKARALLEGLREIESSQALYEELGGDAIDVLRDTHLSRSLVALVDALDAPNRNLRGIDIKKSSLSAMLSTMKKLTKKPRWKLISKLINIASAGRLDLTEEDLRQVLRKNRTPQSRFHS